MESFFFPRLYLRLKKIDVTVIESHRMTFASCLSLNTPWPYIIFISLKTYLLKKSLLLISPYYVFMFLTTPLSFLNSVAL